MTLTVLTKLKKKPRIIAAIITIAFHLLVLLVFLHTFLKFPPDGVVQWPPEPEQNIVFDQVEELYASGEFVRTGDIPDPVALVNEMTESSISDLSATQISDVAVNAGQASEPKKITTTERESSAKVKKEKHGPTKEELQREKERQQAAMQAKAKKNVADATKKAFGGGKGKGTPGAVDGNSNKGAVSGTPGNGLKGRTMENWSSVSSTKLGVIAVRVNVDSQGKVVYANYEASKSSGPVAADAAMRRSCVERTRQCRFSVLEGSPTQSGIITWQFK